MPCQHHDIRKFDGFRYCLACGEAIIHPASGSAAQNEPFGAREAGPRPYRYKPLNHDLGPQIRLVYLLPGHGSDAIVCNIQHCNLADKPVYEALSYSWATEDGDDSLSETIYCNKKPIRITKNCFAALRTLRKPIFRRALWVDAISVDQRNTREKNNQVSIMAEIYSNASQVLAYIGESCLGEGFILDYLETESRSQLHESNIETCEKLKPFLTSLLNQRWFHRFVIFHLIVQVY